MKEGIQFKTVTKVQEYSADIGAYRERFGKEEGERRFFEENTPERERSVTGNVGLRIGIQNMFNLLSAQGGIDAYSNANAEVGVGDDNTAAADTQTDLQAAVNKAYAAMDGANPVVGALADKKITFVGSFATGEANFQWQEVVVRNGQANEALIRKVSSLGTKVSGTWTLTIEITAA